MDWNEVKAKPKKQRKAKQEDEDQYHFGGGFGTGGTLKAGAVKSHFTIGGPKHTAVHSASAVADADYLRDDEEIKYETVSHEVALAVQNARLAKDWSQAELAKKVNEKTSSIIDLENGTAKYNADLVNRCERVLGVKIPRVRNKRK